MEILGNILSVILPIAIVVVFYILFPLWASKFAKQRGMDKLAKAAKISIFVGLGPLGGLVALIAAFNRDPLADHQGVCPECGSAAVAASEKRVDRSSGEEVGTPTKLWLSAVGSVLFGALMIFLAYGLYDEFLEWAGFTGPIPAAIFAIAGLTTILTGIVKPINASKQTYDRVLNLTCKDCAHTWQLKGDAPATSGAAPA